MARYCFYCGRQLEQGEKCHCRERASASDTSYASSSSAWYDTATDRTADSPSPGDARTRQREQPVGGGTPDATKQRSGTRRETWSARRDRKRREKKEKAAHRAAYERNSHARGTYTHPSFGRETRRPRTDATALAAGFIRFFASPAEVMRQSLGTGWTVSHTCWLASSAVLSGIHYLSLNRLLSASPETASAVKADFSYFALSWLTGLLAVAAVILVFTLTMWLIARFLYRQRGLPFSHALAVGKVSWQYLTLLLALSLPSLLTGNALFGITLALMGIVFSVLIHARQVASLTRLDENRTWQFVYLSIIMFAGIFSTMAALSRFLPFSA